MDIERECSVCKEDALYYCRMCISHYCVEHLCMHLAVAQEENSYTNRTEEIEDEDKGSRINQRTERLGVSDLSTATTIRDPIQPLESYSEEELSTQLYFHSDQARRIRFELERRAVFIQSPEERASFKQHHKSKRNTPKQRSIPKGAFHASQLVLNQIRAGNISVQYIIARMNALRTK